VVELPHEAFTTYVPLTQFEEPPRMNRYWYEPVEPFTGAEATATGLFDGLVTLRKTAVLGPGGGDTAPDTTMACAPE
jgi:hypothetical protein